MMKHFCTAAAVLAAFLPTPAGAYPPASGYGQPVAPYGQPYGQSQQQQIDSLQQQIYSIQDQRMKNCVNSRSTYCGWDKGGW